MRATSLARKRGRWDWSIAASRLSSSRSPVSMPPTLAHSASWASQGMTAATRAPSAAAIAADSVSASSLSGGSTWVSTAAVLTADACAPSSAASSVAPTAAVSPSGSCGQANRKASAWAVSANPRSHRSARVDQRQRPEGLHRHPTCADATSSPSGTRSFGSVPSGISPRVIVSPLTSATSTRSGVP